MGTCAGLSSWHRVRDSSRDGQHTLKGWSGAPSARRAQGEPRRTWRHLSGLGTRPSSSASSTGRRDQQTRTFATTLSQLEALGDWLSGLGVTLAGMEATGIYWRTVFEALEPRMECWLINAQHLHNVPGRKTDMIDSAWICQPVEHAWSARASCHPRAIRDLRDLTRPRKAQSDERTRAIQRVEKVLQGAGVKLTSVASQAFSKSARAMLEALVAGTTDPVVLAQLARGRLRSKIPSSRRRSPAAFAPSTTPRSSPSFSPTSTCSMAPSPPWTAGSPSVRPSWRT